MPRYTDMKEASDVIEKIRAMRIEMGMTQHEFARHFGLPGHTYVQWERRRREPDTAAMTLLLVIAIRPRSVEYALSKRRTVFEDDFVPVQTVEPIQQAA
jgi:DNA-binding XRE family transcriptional regulator